MNRLSEVSERAIESPVSRPPSLATLQAGAERRRHVARRRRIIGVATTTALVAIAMVVVLRSGLDESSLSVVGPPPASTAATDDTTATPNPVAPPITDRSLYADPAPTSAGMVLSPPGPYTAGQEITVSVDDPRGRWDPNGAARQCAVIDTVAEICDIRRPTVAYQKLVVRSDVLGPDGLIPCNAPRVTCRVTVGFEDTLASVGSAAIEISGDTPRSKIAIAEPSPLAPHQVVHVNIDDIEQRPASDALVAELPEAQRSQWQQLEPTICRFRHPDEHGYGLHPWDCGGFWPGERTGLVLTAGRTASTGTVTVDRVFFGAGGWQDCGANGCALVMRRNYVASLANPGVNGGTEELASVPLRFDTSGQARTLPTISIDGTGPYVAGAEVTVRGTGFPVGAEPYLGWCVPDGMTSFFGASRLLNCTFGTNITVAADGSFVASSRLNCNAPDRRCLLAWVPGEGSPAYASTPFELGT